MQGLDLARLENKQQFAYVDGLSELFNTSKSSANSVPAFPAGGPARTTLPLRQQPGILPGRTPAPVNPTLGKGNASTPSSVEPGIFKKLHFSGSGITALDNLERDILAVIEKQKTSDDDILLIIDQPDFLLASTGPSQAIGATEMMDWVTGLQQVCLLRSSRPYTDDLFLDRTCTLQC